MTRDEKASLLAGIIVVFFTILAGLGIHFVIQDINKNFDDKGGFKGMVISAGKTWKEIKREINEEEEPDGESTD